MGVPPFMETPVHTLHYISLDIHWLQISVQGRFWFHFCPCSLDLSISQGKNICVTNEYPGIMGYIYIYTYIHFTLLGYYNINP